MVLFIFHRYEEEEEREEHRRARDKEDEAVSEGNQNTKWNTRVSGKKSLMISRG
jgi:hypothetical protein